MSDNESLLEIYMVRNKDGEWFHRKGYSGHGDTWVDDIKKGRIYGKTGGARAVITWFSNNYPEYGTPDLIRLKITDMDVVDESDRVRKAQVAKEKRKLKRFARRKEEEITRQKRVLDEAQKRIQELETN